MKTKDKILEEASKLQDFLLDLEKLFLTEKQFEELSFYKDPEVKALSMMKTEIERDWYTFISGFQNDLDVFIEDWS